LDHKWLDYFDRRRDRSPARERWIGVRWENGRSLSPDSERRREDAPRAICGFCWV